MVVAGTDWTEVVAEATIALAAVTGLLAIAAIVAAVFARSGLKIALADLEESRKAIGAAEATTQRQIEASRQPLLIDVTETTSKNSDLDPENEVELDFQNRVEPVTGWNWRLAYVEVSREYVWVALPLRNVGNGTAVIADGDIGLTGDDALVGHVVGVKVHRERVPPGETMRVLCTHPLVPDSEPVQLRVLVPYGDFARGQATVAKVLIKPHNDTHWRVHRIDYAAIDRD